ncbi:MAG: hypothetical protein ACP5N3_02800 [Candidatus Nanoarchaeia archaeon]
MKSFIDTNGKLVQISENLEDELALKDPVLFARYEVISNRLSVFKHYFNFFYLYPLEDEINLSEEQREKWNGMINYIHSQQELKNAIDLIENLRRDDRGIIGDKALIIQADRPLWDSIINPQADYTAKAWIGTIAEHEIIDPLNPAYQTNETKIRTRIILKDAAPVTKEILGRWVGEKITSQRFHKYYEGLGPFIRELAETEKGSEEIKIEDYYENIEYNILKHKMTKEEAEIADEPYSNHIIVDKYFPLRCSNERELRADEDAVSRLYRTMVLATGRLYKNSSHSSGFVGEDERDIKTIKDELAYHLEKKKGLIIFVGKQLISNITQEQQDFIESQPSPDRKKWLSRFCREKGLALTNQTGISIYYHGKKNREEIHKEFMRVAGEILGEKGYKQSGDLSHGIWGRSYNVPVDFSDISDKISFLGYVTEF